MNKLFSWRLLLLVGGLIGVICAAFLFRAQPKQSTISSAKQSVVVTPRVAPVTESAPVPAPIARRFNVGSVNQSVQPLNPIAVPSNDDDDDASISTISDRPRFVAANSNESRKNTQLDPGLQSAASSLRGYRIAFRQNPVGNNAEITRVLSGKNPRGEKYLPADSRIDDKGQLTDRWDQPIFFHQISGTVMEIRSAGPDHVMWTSDDEALR
jgi:hypothetical protein